MSYILTPFLTRIFTFWDWNVLWSFLAPEKWLMLNKMVTNKLWLFLQTKKYRQRKLNTFSQRPTQLISGRCRIQVVCFLSVTWASNNYRIPLNLKDLAHSLKKKKNSYYCYTEHSLGITVLYYTDYFSSIFVMSLVVANYEH